jgi:HEAT repeat protein
MPLIRKPAAPATAASDPAPECILQGLESNNPEERWSAARAATDRAGNSAALATALRKEDDPRVREAIFTALARIGTNESVDELVSALRSDDASLRTGALDALRIVTGTSRDFVPELLRDADPDIRILTCELARGLGAEEATELLSRLLEVEQQSNVCAAAIDVLAEVGNSKALPALTGCARRFADTPFLVFAIKVATDRINAQSTLTRG